MLLTWSSDRLLKDMGAALPPLLAGVPASCVGRQALPDLPDAPVYSPDSSLSSRACGQMSGSLTPALKVIIAQWIACKQKWHMFEDDLVMVYEQQKGPKTDQQHTA